VAEALHFGRAAEKLHIPQPPLSHQIGQLEAELGVRLFNRNNRRVELTPAGVAFLEDARNILAIAGRAVDRARRAGRGELGSLNIGFVGSAMFGQLPEILQAFRQRYPEVNLVLDEMNPWDQAPALRDKEIDLGFCRPAAAGEDLACETVWREPLVLVLPQAHPLAHQEAVSLTALSQEPFVSFTTQPEPSLGKYVMDLLLQAGFTPYIVQQVLEVHMALSLVAAGLGVALVPWSAQNSLRKGVIYRPIREPVADLDLLALYRKDDPSPVLQQFLQLMRACMTAAAIG
jgi:DNA-binding transcriptional LysR family regulator